MRVSIVRGTLIYLAGYKPSIYREDTMRIKKYLFVSVLLLLLTLTGCNIFSWTHSHDESHVDRGLDFMRQSRYAEAEVEFTRAMEENPNNADARYYHAKALLNNASFDILDLMREISQAETDREQQGAAIPLFDKEVTVADEIYRVHLTIVDDLQPISNGQTQGSISSEDIDVDLAVAYLISAILSLRDTNRDSTIDDNDILLDIIFSSDLGTYSIGGIEQFLGEVTRPRSVGGMTPFINPDEINPFIDSVVYLIEESEDVIVTVVQRMTEGLSVENIQVLLDDIRTTIVKYYYDDNRDNDGDFFIDEEILNGLDDDEDGYCDEDTDHV